MTPHCEFVVATGAAPCGALAPRELDGRALCDDHLLAVLVERNAKARRRAGLPPRRSANENGATT